MEAVPRFLDEVPITEIRRYVRKAWRYIELYLNGYNGYEAEKGIKQYKSHRRIFYDYNA